jgi:hypothetical protein
MANTWQSLFYHLPFSLSSPVILPSFYQKENYTRFTHKKYIHLIPFLPSLRVSLHLTPLPKWVLIVAFVETLSLLFTMLCPISSIKIIPSPRLLVASGDHFIVHVP